MVLNATYGCASIIVCANYLMVYNTKEMCVFVLIHTYIYIYIYIAINFCIKSVAIIVSAIIIKYM